MAADPNDARGGVKIALRPPRGAKTLPGLFRCLRLARGPVLHHQRRVALDNNPVPHQTARVKDRAEFSRYQLLDGYPGHDGVANHYRREIGRAHVWTPVT